MQTLGQANETPRVGSGATAMRLDLSSVVTRVVSVNEARALPPGSIVGDHAGGLTFSDAVAEVLESRSCSGWREIEAGPGEHWTIISLDR